MADWKRGLRRVLYPAYEARLVRRLPESLPRHVGVMLDGNRRWAKAVGRDTAHGHRASDPARRVMKAERIVIDGKSFNLYPDRDS